MNINLGKLIVLIFCCLMVIPMIMLIVGAMVYQSDYTGSVFNDTTLGKLCDLSE